MNIRYIFCLVALALLAFAACGPASTQPSLSPEDIYATAEVLAKTSIAQTSAAMYTATPSPTETPLPTETTTPAPPTETGTPTETPTSTGEPYLPTALNVTPHGPLGRINLVNETGKDITLVIYSSTYYNEYRFRNGFTIQVPLGDYAFYGYIGENRSFSGTIKISDTIHAWTLYFGKDKVKVITP